MKRKIISLILVLVLILSVMPTALAAEGSFTDITDEATAHAAETLRLLGVVDGVGGGKFNPAGNLKRAEFCKMAVVMLGIEDQEPGYRNRTIFTDVTSTHWARGYINLAASGKEAFISGMGNGVFAPDQHITYAQAVTILVRLLGYSDSDTNMQWPEGYLTLADSIGLTGEFSLSANAAITRAQAARLFEKMLLCKTKDGAAYLNRFGSVTEKAIILSNDAVAADGSAGAVYTSAGTYKTDVPVSDDYVGQRGTLAVADGKLVVFIPNDENSLTVSVAAVESGWFKTSAGTRYNVASDTVVYTEDGITSWGDVWLDMFTGSNIIVYFDAKGSIEALFYATSAADGTVAAAMNEVKGNPFTSLLGCPADTAIFKNGAPATAADIRRYDVAEYDKAAKQLRINDLKLTGIYENAYPGPASPEQIKFLGRLWDVLPSARESLEKFELGDTMTLLFTADMRVAGAVTTREAGGNAVGIVTAQGGGTVSVELLAARNITISGKSVKNSVNMQGELVTFTANAAGELSLRSLPETVRAEKISIAKMTFGDLTISPSVKIFERVGRAMPVRINLTDLPDEISRADVIYAGTDYAGRVDMLILNDVTGDGYTYGHTLVMSEEETVDGQSTTDYTLTLTNSEGSVTHKFFPINILKSNSYGGIATSIDGSRVIAAVALTRIKDVSRSDFRTVGEETTLTVDGITYPVADNVQCYNAAAGEWFDTLDDARRFSATLTVYYDRDPAKGGKIRVVVAE